MAPDDRNPKRGASPMQAGETPTSRDDGYEPTTISPMPERPNAQRDRRAVKPEARVDPRTTEVFPERRERPDVLGAPERTVIAPLPPRHVEVDPIPEASSNASRLAAEADARRRHRKEEDARARGDNARRDVERRNARDERTRQESRERERDRDSARDRDRRDPRETDRELAVPRSAAKENTAPAGAAVAAHDRDDGRPRPRERGSDPGLVHQPTSIERANADTPWSRLGVALRDVSNAVVVSTKETWTVLRTEGVKPLVTRLKPGAQRAWNATRGFLLRMRAVAVTKAVELGLVKPKRVGTDYEQHGDDRLDQGRVDAWRKFHKGKTSSSYLQDDE